MTGPPPDPRGSLPSGKAREDDAPRPLAPRIRWRPHKAAALTIGIGLLVLGLFLFTHHQTQPLFRIAMASDSVQQWIPRQRGPVIGGALLASLGLMLSLGALSPLRRRQRILPGLLFAASGALILLAHFTIYPNSIVLRESRFITMQASFLFHDTAATIAIATFILAFATLLVLAVAALALMRLLVPRTLNDYILHPKDRDAHRARLAVLTLLVVAAGSQLVRWFFQFAVTTDANPSGHFFTTNLIAIYYLKAALLAWLLLLVGWRTLLLLWGRLDDRISARFRRQHARTLRAETWTWAILLTLTLVVLLSLPLYTPSDGADRVFAVDSRGVSWFLLVVLGLYALQRRSTQTHHRALRTAPRPLRRAGPDRLLVATAGTALIWSFGWIPGALLDASPLVSLTLRVAPITILLFAVSMRIDPARIAPGATGSTAPVLLLSGALLAVLTGIMLWGVGNSVTVLYSQASGGFLTPEGRFLQPFSTGLRLLAAFFLVAPLLILFWLLVARHRDTVSPGPFMLSGVSFVLMMNLLFTIDPASRFDAALGRRDVLIGFWTYVLATPFDIAAMSTIWAASAIAGILCVLLLVHRGRDRWTPPAREPLVWRELLKRVRRLG